MRFTISRVAPKRIETVASTEDSFCSRAECRVAGIFRNLARKSAALVGMSLRLTNTALYSKHIKLISLARFIGAQNLTGGATGTPEGYFFRLAR